MDRNCAAKRAAEEVMDSICSGCPKKLKLVDVAPDAAAAHHGVEAPKKKVKRLSQRKIDYILSRRKRPPYSSPDEFPILSNPGPDYSQAQADDFREMLLGWQQSREALWKMISEMQEFVRRELAAKGFVEVDEDHCLLHGRDVEVDYESDTMSDAESDPDQMDYAEEDYADEDYAEEDYAEENYLDEDNVAEEEHAYMIYS